MSSKNLGRRKCVTPVVASKAASAIHVVRGVTLIRVTLVDVRLGHFRFLLGGTLLDRFVGHICIGERHAREALRGKVDAHLVAGHCVVAADHVVVETLRGILFVFIHIVVLPSPLSTHTLTYLAVSRTKKSRTKKSRTKK
jgi:hypothetical protein